MSAHRIVARPQSISPLARRAAASRSRGSLLRLLGYLRPHWLHAVAAALAMVATTALDLAQPWIIGFLLVGEVMTQGNLGLLPWAVGLLGGVIAAKQVGGYFRGYLTEGLSQKILHRLRSDVYQHMELLPVRFFDRNRAGEVVSRVMSDTDQVEGVMTTGLSSIGSDAITVAGASVLLFSVNPSLALLVVPVIVALAVIVNVFRKTIKRSSRRIREAVGELAAKTNETVSGIRTVKSFAMEQFEALQFHMRSLGIVVAKVRLAKLAALYSSTADLMTGVAVLVVLAVAAPGVVGGALSLGALVAFLGYVEKLFRPVTSLSKANLSIQKATASAERIFQLMDAEPESGELESPANAPPIRGFVEFANITFAYEPGRVVLRDFSLVVEAGQKVALVGRSGAGKSTVISLLLRFYEPTAGRIRIDGRPINAWALRVFRRQIGVVLQEPFLFSGSIRENISYGDPQASEAAIVDAAKAANAHAFVMALPEGYNTQVGERGVKLSGGQRQRIAIARALLKNPRILILDEATSNVDAESEVLIREAMERFAEGRTTFIIAHRLSTVMNADKTVVIEEGGIAEIGTHHGLLRRGGRYARLYEAQVENQNELLHSATRASPDPSLS